MLRSVNVDAIASSDVNRVCATVRTELAVLDAMLWLESLNTALQQQRYNQLLSALNACPYATAPATITNLIFSRMGDRALHFVSDCEAAIRRALPPESPAILRACTSHLPPYPRVAQLLNDLNPGRSQFPLNPAALSRHTDASHATMRFIPGGSYTIGSPPQEPGRYDNEGPVRLITVASFWMDETEITQALYDELIGSNPSKFRNATSPVERVSWFDVIAFCNARSHHEGLPPYYSPDGMPRTNAVYSYRLPTDAEWEYACRAGTKTPYAFGLTLSPQHANYHDTSSTTLAPSLHGKATMPVKLFPANDWGLYDMHGNVLKWCHDAYAEQYGQRPDPRYRVVRGGSWFHPPDASRSAYRYFYEPTHRASNVGFRCVRSVFR